MQRSRLYSSKLAAVTIIMFTKLNGNWIAVFNQYQIWTDFFWADTRGSTAVMYLFCLFM